jgi:hypothetical protein
VEFKRARAWEILNFASFGQYCEERLGMAKRTVAQAGSAGTVAPEIPAAAAGAAREADHLRKGAGDRP